jgi:hypothetical protein
MASPARPKLTIPAVLAVSALTIGCPAGDDGDTGNETGSQTTAPTDGTASTSEGPTTGMTGTGADTGSTSGALPDCESLDETMCNATSGCFWEGPDIGCLVDCSLIEDQATCETFDYCEWFEEACYTTI